MTLIKSVPGKLINSSHSLNLMVPTTGVGRGAQSYENIQISSLQVNFRAKIWL